MNNRRCALIAIGLWLAFVGAHAHADEGSTIPAREAVWQAALKAVHARGLRVVRVSADEGSIETSSGSLAGADIPRVIVADEAERGAVWRSGEYRYRIRIVAVDGRLRVRTRAEITAWRAEPLQTPSDERGPPVKLRSNDVLEREFAAALRQAVAEVVSE